MTTNENKVIQTKEAEREAAGLPKVEDLKKKYGEIYEITVVVDEDDVNEGRSLVYYFKKPSTASFNRYLKTAGKNMATSTTNFVIDNIVEEQLEPFKAE